MPEFCIRGMQRTLNLRRGSNQLAPNAGVLPASWLQRGLGAVGDSVYRPADVFHTPSVGVFMNSLPIK